jgi:hypothetical protein
VKKIPPFRLVPDPLDEEAEQLPGFKWAAPPVGKRHRLGGDADVPNQAWPDCPACDESMSFYGQLDSINDEFVLADCGLLKIFVCFDCLESVSLIWST